ncbi:unnamed protein product [Arabidopsis arenosa]|uniref:Pentatricopeptide repeat-containing protein n=1 Tax=Arabidopsis arenosa TaxID=38785 RepID=A0A8S2AX33_ARAAE|nr:unnamed protein product [Arabidopsis arenosa]
MVLLHTSVGFFKRFSTSATQSTSSASDWKTQQTLFRLATEISSILLQRRNWISHLQYVKSKLPRSTLTSPIFLQILRETRKCPKTTLDFFDFAKIHLRFEPDFKSHCRVIEVATESGLLERAETLLRPLVETNSVSLVVGSMHRWFEGEVSLSVSLSLVIECYVLKGLLPKWLGKNQFRVALCLYSAMVRNGIVSNELTWDLVAQILCEQGRSKSVVKLMETGVESCKIYTNLVECYSRNGEFDAAFSLIHEMDGKKLELSFSSYGGVLDDACRLGNAELIDKVLGLMVEKKFRTLGDSAVNDQMIERLCDMGKTFASEMLFRKACNGETVLLYLMRVAITEFANALCRDDNSSEEEEELLVDVIKCGFVPCTHKLSEVLASMCRKRRWKSAEKLLDSVMEMEVYFDSFSCGLLMERYCRSGKVEKALELHEKIKKMKGSLDVNAYNAVLDRLMMRQKEMVEEAVGVFEYMKEMKSVNSKSFTIMIQGLCRVKEMKKAMRSHDEMLRVGMKPDLVTYKRLILGFK